MTLADYATLIAIAEYHSLTLAADHLHLTKSAVSHSVAKMEEELRLPLFSRAQKKWTLTESGKKLLPFAYSVLREDNRFMEVVHEIHNLTSGTVTIGACSSTCINWIPEILNSCRELYPNIYVRIKGGTSNTQIINYLDNNEIDLGIAAAEATQDLGVIELYEDEMLCVTSKSFLPRTPGVVSAEELKNLPLLLSAEDFGAEALVVLDALNMLVKGDGGVSGSRDVIAHSPRTLGIIPGRHADCLDLFKIRQLRNLYAISSSVQCTHGMDRIRARHPHDGS